MKEKVIISQAVQDFLNAVYKTSSIEILEASAEDLVKLEKWGIKKTDDIAVIKGTYLHVDKANRNGDYLSKATVEAGLLTIVGKPMNLFHKRENPKGFYFDAEVVDTAMVTKAIFWKALFSEDYANIEIWVKAGVAGQSFELKYGKATFRKNDKGEMEIDIQDVTFVGGAILPKDKAADKDTSLEVLAKELSTKYPDLVFAFALPEEEDGSAEEDAAVVEPVKPEEEAVAVVPVKPEEEDGSSEEDAAVKKSKEDAALIEDLQNTVSQLTTQFADALEQLKIKIYSEEEVVVKIKEATDAKDAEAIVKIKEAVDAKEKEINLKHEEEKSKESRLVELDKIKPLTAEEKTSIDVTTPEKFELAKVTREKELLELNGLSMGGTEHGNDSRAKGDPNME